MAFTKKHVLQEIRRTAAENAGVALGFRRFATETGIRENDWKGKLWARWSDAVVEAGFAPNTTKDAYEDADLLNAYARLTLRLRRIPTLPDMRLSTRNGERMPEWKAYKRRFDSKESLIAHVIDYCTARSELSEAVPILQAYVPQVPAEDAGESTDADAVLGVVYLMKSGRFYKIGKSNASGRRHYELSIQLPEKLRIIHEIRTDDPTGIEMYWHNRFSAKRQNGEWFQLDAAEVAAFRRRKFM